MQSIGVLKEIESVLLIDCDRELCEVVKQCLEKEGLNAEIVHEAEEGLRRALSADHAIVILDIVLSGLNGFELLRGLRAKSQIPVVVTTTRSEEVDRIVALEIGADDYLIKPFNPRELIARIRAVLRRVRSCDAEGTLSSHRVIVADVEMDTAARRTFRAGEPVILTAMEFDLLQVLLRNAGRVVAREDLAQSALGRQFSPLDRSIDLHVSHLRRKLGQYPAGSARIKAIRGIGYLYALPLDGQNREPMALANEPEGA